MAETVEGVQTIDANTSARPLLTVALPVFNGGAELKLAVHSVVQQTFRDWELLILDDGSTDQGLEYLRDLKDDRIFIIRDGQNLGLAARLNQAISLARGRYFARMDHDDICHPERFARQINYLIDSPSVDLVATRCITIDRHNRISGVLPSAIEHAHICRYPWMGFYMAHPSWMGTARWFRKYLYQVPSPYCSEDQELLLRAYNQSRYYTLPQYLLAYRVRSHTPWLKLWRTRLALCRVQARYFLKHREFFNAAASITVTVLRVLRDAAEYPVDFAVRQRRGLKSVPMDELAGWVSRLERIENVAAL